MPGTFPTLANDPDSKKHSYSQEDPAIRVPTEGGYEFTRPRHTRSLRKTYKVGFTYIPESDKVLLEAFFESMRGGSDYFTWVDPASGTTRTVRFTGPIDYKYVGRLNNKRWDASFEVKEI